MLNKMLLASLATLGFTLMVGCASDFANYHTVPVQTVALGNLDPVILRVSGNGTYGKSDALVNPNQTNLMAMRASKMDAYRNMAERVYGTRIQGNTTVQNLATRDDNIRGYVDNLVRGAKIISTREISKNSYETQMELVLEPRFQHCMLKGASMVADPNCSQHSVHGEHPSQRLPVSQQMQPSATQTVIIQPRSRYLLH
ncbi:MAG: hypothetical protein GX029_08865 [Pseudomonadaceae bacterium]|nr:hypothetical protein [Pseudomonadaceae bacterium]